MKLFHNLVIWIKNKQIDFQQWAGIEGLKFHWVLLAFLIEVFLVGWLTSVAMGFALAWAIGAVIQQVRLDRQEFFRKHPTKDPPLYQPGSMMLAFFINFVLFTVAIYMAWMREAG